VRPLLLRLTSPTAFSTRHRCQELPSTELVIRKGLFNKLMERIQVVPFLFGNGSRRGTHQRFIPSNGVLFILHSGGRIRSHVFLLPRLRQIQTSATRGKAVATNGRKLLSLVSLLG